MSDAQQSDRSQNSGVGAKTHDGFQNKVRETTKQYYLIIIHLVIAVAAFVTAAIYVRYVQEFGKLPFIDLSNIDKIPPEFHTKYYIAQILNSILLSFTTYLPILISIWVGFTFAKRANTLMRAAFYEQTSVVPQKDYELVQQAIQQGNPAPITEYIRLVSLTGGVGIFQKIGLTGLPLVTLGLVVFFSCGVLFMNDKEHFQAFLDFTKLTLGAFIGSFVQRQVETRSKEAELQKVVDNIKRGATDASIPAASTNVASGASGAAATGETKPSQQAGQATVPGDAAGVAASDTSQAPQSSNPTAPAGAM